ncbi:Uncharacterised protein [Bordetella ansorpii]|uniref:Uncharacterized protein n=1 Tax=Bordetella ansorpii TaxID=288768 RepID=A0A157QNZ1_9BORD|nr:hypothetical protein [Bordetella ansorpii]SAI47592.1 Uncharacterised protein [Bordetella ansorpii]
MPAIPIMARVEAHMYDHQLIALNGLLERLLIAHYETTDSPFHGAADGDSDLAADMLEGACQLHVAARRAMRERDMLEAA